MIILQFSIWFCFWFLLLCFFQSTSYCCETVHRFSVFFCYLSAFISHWFHLFKKQRNFKLYFKLDFMTFMHEFLLPTIFFLFKGKVLPWYLKSYVRGLIWGGKRYSSYALIIRCEHPLLCICHLPLLLLFLLKHNVLLFLIPSEATAYTCFIHVFFSF